MRREVSLIHIDCMCIRLAHARTPRVKTISTDVCHFLLYFDLDLPKVIARPCALGSFDFSVALAHIMDFPPYAMHLFGSFLIIACARLCTKTIHNYSIAMNNHPLFGLDKYSKKKTGNWEHWCGAATILKWLAMLVTDNRKLFRRRSILNRVNVDGLRVCARIIMRVGSDGGYDGHCMYICYTKYENYFR